MRRAELLGVLSTAADLGMGAPADLGLRTAALAVALARRVGLAGEPLRDVFELALLRFVGCTADSDVAAAAFGDEIAARGFLAPADFGRPAHVVALVARNIAADQPPLRRALRFGRALANMSRLFGAARAHCEVAERLAARLGVSAAVRQGLTQVFERWDGKGIPERLRGEEVARPVRIITLAHDVVVHHRLAGAAAAVAMARQRSGGAHEPALVARFCAEAPALLATLEEPSPWQAALDAEPAPQARYGEAQADEAFAALGDFADLKSRYTPGHSSRVAALVCAAAGRAGVPPERLAELRRAALAHDLGRVGVSAGIWDKAGPLSDADWEKIRLHPYYTERCFARSPALAPLGILAGRHHERTDGAGYPKGLPREILDREQRLLAAADVYAALTEARPHRAALEPEAAARELRREAARGRLAHDAVDAILAGAGHAVARARGRATTLSDRERQVLALVSRGLSNKEMARELGISAKTVGHHVQHIYDKIGVSTRAAATLYAAEHGLVGGRAENRPP